MSRIGNAPILLPQGVEVTVSGRLLEVKGPKGRLIRECHPDVTVAVQDRTLVVRRATDQEHHRALHGLTRALIANMVRGVTEGYKVELEIHGVGYRVAKQGNALFLQVGYSHPLEVVPPEGIQFEVPQPNRIIVTGIDKELVGQMAARLRAIRPPDPYKGKGIRYAAERVKLKPGKAGRTIVGKV